MKVKDFIDLINSNKDKLPSLSSLVNENRLNVNLPKKVGSILDSKIHRWWTDATIIFECEDGLVGVTGFDYSHSDDICAEDCNSPCNAVEYEEFTIISYRPKK